MPGPDNGRVRRGRTPAVRLTAAVLPSPLPFFLFVPVPQVDRIALLPGGPDRARYRAKSAREVGNDRRLDLQSAGEEKSTRRADAPAPPKEDLRRTSADATPSLGWGCRPRR